MLVLFLVMTSIQAQADQTWESGHHVFSEGYEAEIDMLNSATADITGGEIGILRCQDTSEVDVYAGSDIDLLRPHDSSIANVYGGDINTVFTLGSSYTKIYSGNIIFIDAVELSELDLYVDSYVWDPTGGTWDDGLLTGVWWNNGGSFNIEIIDLDTINHINFVPEPCIGILITIGWFISRKRKSVR